MSISEFRQQIDEIDNRLSRLLKERFDLVTSIGKEKSRNGLTVVDVVREQAILDRLAAEYPEYGEEIQAIYRTIFQVSRKRQL